MSFQHLTDVIGTDHLERWKETDSHLSTGGQEAQTSNMVHPHHTRLLCCFSPSTTNSGSPRTFGRAPYTSSCLFPQDQVQFQHCTHHHHQRSGPKQGGTPDNSGCTHLAHGSLQPPKPSPVWHQACEPTPAIATTTTTVVVKSTESCRRPG